MAEHVRGDGLFLFAVVLAKDQADVANASP
jgi:hypothetical protein